MGFRSKEKISTFLLCFQYHEISFQSQIKHISVAFKYFIIVVQPTIIVCHYDMADYKIQ